MRTLERSIKSFVLSDLKEKMVLLGGPRQVGKTTLSLQILGGAGKSSSAYLNWDVPGVSSDLLKGILPANEKLIVLDEIHKYGRWRNLIKGFYDKYYPEKNFIITGSAKLDHYRKGGDSLLGRYHYHRIHPFSLLELNSKPSQKDFEQLLFFGGFPAPLIKADTTYLRRWQRERLHQVIREDLVSLERVEEIGLIELLAGALPERIGSPLSISNLAQDIQVSHQSIQRWLKIFENLYYCFRISPFGSPKIRAVKKEQKLYLWDWSEVPEGGARFENMMACQLLKYCHFIEDTEGFSMDLRFIRDTDKREVDFVVLKDKKPLFAVECKTGERSLSSAIRYFEARTSIPNFFQVHQGKLDYEKEGIRVLPFITFCKQLKLP